MSTAIPYLTEVWNVTTGCSPISVGCDHCYAERMTHRNLPQLTAGHGFTPTFHASRLEQPLHWRKPRVVGVSFMGDLFHEAITDEHRDSVFIRFAMCPAWKLDPGPDDEPCTGAHTFLVLTKRAEAMHRYLTDPDRWLKLEEAMEREGFGGETMDLVYDNTKGHSAFPNVHLGVTVCNQEEADRNVPLLLDTPAAGRWVSLEPMLGPVDLDPWIGQVDFCKECDAENPPQDSDLCPECGGAGHLISTWGDEQAARMRSGERYENDGPHAADTASPDWVVLGGETGPGARPMEWRWALDVRDQCQAAGVPFYWKQPGDWLKRSEREMSDELAAGVFEMAATRELPVAP